VAAEGARLVPPDQYVAWVGDAPPPAADALLQWVTGRTPLARLHTGEGQPQVGVRGLA